MLLKQIRHRLRRARQWLRAAAEDARHAIAGTGDPELPPMRMRFVGAGDFRAVGEELVQLLIAIGGLQPADRVLDVGSGIGRVAIPLTRYLDRQRGTYDGFDIVRRGVEWCRRELTPRHPHFRFHLAAVRNPEYNPRGIPAAEYRFPFDDASFDVAFATSLYTHLELEEMRRYVAETHRVLAPGGTFFATFFLLNEISLANMGATYDFPLGDAQVRRMKGASAAAGVAFDETLVLETLRGAGFVDVAVHHGKWSGRADGLTFQDLVTARRP
jgi:SAM-dependent methyltransferase